MRRWRGVELADPCPRQIDPEGSNAAGFKSFDLLELITVM